MKKYHALVTAYRVLGQVSTRSKWDAKIVAGTLQPVTCIVYGDSILVSNVTFLTVGH